jgi:hypothetical protein
LAARLSSSYASCSVALSLVIKGLPFERPSSSTKPGRALRCGRAHRAAMVSCGLALALRGFGFGLVSQGLKRPLGGKAHLC